MSSNSFRSGSSSLEAEIVPVPLPAPQHHAVHRPERAPPVIGGPARRATAASRYRLLDSALHRDGRHSSNMIVASSRAHLLVVDPADLNPTSTASPAANRRS